MFERFPNDVGIEPLNEFPSRFKVVSFPRFPSAEGIEPLKLLFSRYNSDKFDKFPNSEGIVPLKLLLDSLKLTKLDKFPRADGIVPLKLPINNSPCRLLSLPNEAGIAPVNWLSTRRRAVTLLALFLVFTSTPFHDVMTVAAFQLSGLTRLSVLHLQGNTGLTGCVPASLETYNHIFTLVPETRNADVRVPPSLMSSGAVNWCTS